jgi:hypothetical protein
MPHAIRPTKKGQKTHKTRDYFFMAFYDPVDPGKPLRPFYTDLCPRKLSDAIEIADEYNRIAADIPELHEVLGIFEQTKEPRKRWHSRVSFASDSEFIPSPWQSA